MTDQPDPSTSGGDEALLSRRRFTALCALAALGAAAAPALTAQEGVREVLARRHSRQRAPRGAATPARPQPAAAPARAAAPAHAAAPTRSGAQVWADLLRGNRRFVAGAPAGHELVRTRRTLAGGQHPQAIVLCCSDSRVPPELVFDRGLGELFVVRTAGSITDPVALGSIEYAVEHLRCPLLVVLGHDRCGAVAAAASGEPMPTPSLSAIVRRIAPSVARARAGGRRDPSGRAEVEANVRDSAARVLRSSPVVGRAVQTGRMQVVRAVYRLETGEVATLA